MDEISKAMAIRVLHAADDFESRLQFAFQLVLIRTADVSEAERFSAFRDQVMSNRGEGQGRHDHPDIHLWRLICQVILNLDETITKE